MLPLSLDWQQTAVILPLATGSPPQVNANDPGASPASAMQDRAVGFAYEPGSTFKAVTVSGALQERLITPDTGFNVPDLTKFYEEMRAKGVKFSMPPKKQDFGGMLAQFVDSEGAHVSVGAQG